MRRIGEALLILSWLYTSITMASERLAKIVPTLALRSHPRLLVSAEQFAGLRKHIDADPLLARVYASEKKAGDALLGQPALRYEKQGVRLLAVSRAALARVSRLAMLYRVSGDQ